MNSKVICFESDVYDLSKQEDVESMVCLISNLFLPDEMGVVLDDGNTIDLEREDGTDSDIVLCIGDIAYK